MSVTRADRLLSLLDVLRASEETTVAALAEELEVSRRTLLRDLAALRDRGVAIASEAGRGGGVRLERDGGATRVVFADEEIVALWLTAHLARVATGLPWSGATRGALAKLFAGLPRSRARELRALCNRVVVGRAATPPVRASASAPPAELLAIFERAFTARLGMTFDYTDRDGRLSSRRIEPHGLLVEPPVWYILARDCDKTAARSFRMDRIRRPRIAPSIRFTPDADVITAMTAHLREPHGA